jgi:hypothetical protein
LINLAQDRLVVDSFEFSDEPHVSIQCEEFLLPDENLLASVERLLHVVNLGYCSV